MPRQLFCLKNFRAQKFNDKLFLFASMLQKCLRKKNRAAYGHGLTKFLLISKDDFGKTILHGCRFKTGFAKTSAQNVAEHR